jgi:hypothetical protein
MAQWPHERSLVKNFADKPFALIGIHINYDSDDAGKVKAVMAKEKLNWRSFVDRGTIAEKWKPAGTPTFYIIDPKGVIRHKWAGAPGAKAIDRALEKLIQEAGRDTQNSPK